MQHRRRRFSPIVAALVAGCTLSTPDEIVRPPARTIDLDGGTEVNTDGGTAPTIPFTKAALVEAGAACAMSRYESFRAAARTFQSKSAEWAAEPTPTKRVEARDAWRAALSRWQEAELFRIGPAARPPEIGAQSLRDEIYGWPLFGRCSIEEQLVARGYAGAGFSTALVNVRTLAAADFLLYSEDPKNACGSFSRINSEGTWAALSADDLTKRRAEYTAAIAADVVAKADRLADAWAPDKGNFLGALKTAGAGSTLFPTEQDALNGLNHALFYIEHEVKDLKLGLPLGIASECFKDRCPELLESQFAKVSLAHLKDNLKGARHLFVGCSDDGESLGFDDWLWAVGAGDVATRMVAALDEADAAAAALSDPLEVPLLTEAAKVERLYIAVKRFTDLLKSEFVTVLNLELPTHAEGDND